ncbi:interleukin-1 receptor type 2-like isoform X2 [Genypterus blacodes]|uniref:interleukin-1 receptor type 2-like isoform X2 n=1 Tax=Genypterus blacodes TaxID=154954 RepID=UPI003F761752
MVPSVLLWALIALRLAHGRPALPPLPMTELQMFSVEREAVVLAFPKFQRVLKVRRIATPTAPYLITRSNGTEGAAYGGDGRIQQHDRQLWLLPAQASDSGEYSCTFRNETYCITGSIMLVVYKSASVDMEKLSYPIPVTLGEELRFDCPALDHFNHTEQVEWYKDSGPGALRQTGLLLIPAVDASHRGLYTCRLTVLIHNQQYKVSRKILLQVQDLDQSDGDLSVTSDPGLISSTVHTPMIQPPVIVSPRNGSVFESPHGSGLELLCKVLTGCQAADATAVEWQVNGQSAEASYLDGWGLLRGRRVTRVQEGCYIELRLVVMALTEVHTRTELKCVAHNEGGRQEAFAQLQLEDSASMWLTIGAVSLSCVLTVVLVFLYVLYKSSNKRKRDYFLARQNSTF